MIYLHTTKRTKNELERETFIHTQNKKNYIYGHTIVKVSNKKLFLKIQLVEKRMMVSISFFTQISILYSTACKSTKYMILCIISIYLALFSLLHFLVVIYIIIIIFIIIHFSFIIIIIIIIITTIIIIIITIHINNNSTTKITFS